MGALRRGRSLLAAIALVSAAATGCASPPAQPDPVSTTRGPGPDVEPVDPTASLPGGTSSGGPAAPASTGPTAGQRAQSAVEGLLMGAIIGGQAGPIGAAVGGVTMLVYSAVTGDVPFQGGPGGSGRGGAGSPTGREEDLDRQIEAEVARQDSLEAEIEAELRRQEELLRQIDRDDALRQAEEAQKPTDTAMLDTDPRAAPRAPAERDLPLSIFDEQRRTVPAGTWGNERPLDAVVRSLDADRDGAPEEVRYYDARTGALLRKENDENYDGTMDTWTTYDAGLVAEIVRDANGDGKPDEWERYGRDGRMETREVDRDGDGTRDAFYSYEGGSLVEERHDGNSDGRIDRVVHYEQRRIARTEEDTNGDGVLDTTTFFAAGPGGNEVIERVEKDTDGDGRVDTFERYEQVAGKPSLVRRDEDRNGDGTIDVKSIYENGKLKQREISDPALLPL